MIDEKRIEQYRQETREQQAAALREWRMDRLVETVRAAGDKGVTRSELLRRSKTTAAVFDRMLAEMSVRGLVRVTVTASGMGRPLTTIRSADQ